MIELTSRQKIILSLIVHEHTRTAQPVASKTLIEDFGLQISSATVRSEMNTLTELGLIRQPHTSAGRVPTEEGYRFFVSNLVQQTALPTATRNTISHQFYQSRRGLDHWLPLAAPATSTSLGRLPNAAARAFAASAGRLLLSLKCAASTCPKRAWLMLFANCAAAALLKCPSSPAMRRLRNSG